MDLSQSTTTYETPLDRSWLASQLGTNAIQSGSIDVTKLVAQNYAVDPVAAGTSGSLAVPSYPQWPQGFLPSGLFLGLVTATGLYAPYASGASDGTQTPAAILYTATRVVPRGQAAPISATVQVALLLGTAIVRDAAIAYINQAAGTITSGLTATPTAVKNAFPSVRFV